MISLSSLARFGLLLTVSACACEGNMASFEEDRAEQCLAEGYAMDTPEYAGCIKNQPSEQEVQQFRNTVGTRPIQGL